MAAASTGSSLPPAPASARAVGTPFADEDYYMNGASGRAWTSTMRGYECLKQIGKGSYGQVWKARCRYTGKFVALKMILQVATSEGFPRTALREIRMLKQLKHKNIVNLLDVVIATPEDTEAAAGTPGAPAVIPGAVYLVYEYADYDFTGLLDGSMLSADAVRSYTFQLLAGLAHLHASSNRIVHRDIKCSNILLGEDNTVKVADFGLARRMDKDPGRPMSNNVITLWYRPPELLLGAETYTANVDVWSAGCVLMELIVGKPLFKGKTEPEQLSKIFALMGTPSTHSSLRRLPGWARTAFPPKPCQLEPEITKWCRNKNVTLPSEALSVISRMLDIDPLTRLSADRLLTMPWFQGGIPLAVGSVHTIPFDPKNPTAGLPSASALAGLDPDLDYHELAARQRRKSGKAARPARPRTDGSTRSSGSRPDRDVSRGRYDRA